MESRTRLPQSEHSKCAYKDVFESTTKRLSFFFFLLFLPLGASNIRFARNVPTENCHHFDIFLFLIFLFFLTTRTHAHTTATHTPHPVGKTSRTRANPHTCPSSFASPTNHSNFFCFLHVHHLNHFILSFSFVFKSPTPLSLLYPAFALLLIPRGSPSAPIVLSIQPHSRPQHCAKPAAHSTTRFSINTYPTVRRFNNCLETSFKLPTLVQ